MSRRASSPRDRHTPSANPVGSGTRPPPRDCPRQGQARRWPARRRRQTARRCGARERVGESRYGEHQRAADEPELHGPGQRTELAGREAPRASEIVRRRVGREPERRAEELATTTTATGKRLTTAFTCVRPERGARGSRERRVRREHDATVAGGRFLSNCLAAARRMLQNAEPEARGRSSSRTRPSFAFATSAPTATPWHTFLLAPPRSSLPPPPSRHVHRPYALVERGDASETRKEARVVVTMVDGKSTRDPRITDPLAPVKHVITLHFDYARGAFRTSNRLRWTSTPVPVPHRGGLREQDEAGLEAQGIRPADPQCTTKFAKRLRLQVGRSRGDPERSSRAQNSAIVRRVSALCASA